MIAETDAMLGEVMKTLDDLRLTDNTYLIFSSDHGEGALEHKQYYKMSLFEASARVPLIIAGPGVRHGAAVDDMVSLVDIYPTLMDMAGLKTPAGLDGHSLHPLMENKRDGSNPVRPARCNGGREAFEAGFNGGGDARCGPSRSKHRSTPAGGAQHQGRRPQPGWRRMDQ